MMKSDSALAANILGWREWVSLPALGLSHIKAKVDTGARTSALHAFSLSTFQESGVLMVRFNIHPMQKRNDIQQECVAEVIDRRLVSDSGGHKEERLIIRTPVRLGEDEWPIEISLTKRDNMRFRMLLGRTAVRGRYLVNAKASYLIGHGPKEIENKG
jgi:hypothetical protein